MNHIAEPCLQPFTFPLGRRPVACFRQLHALSQAVEHLPYLGALRLLGIPL